MGEFTGYRSRKRDAIDDIYGDACDVPVPKPLMHVELRAMGNLTQNEARLVGQLNFVSKCLSSVGNKRISQFFDSAHAPRSRVIPCGFFCCCRYIIAWNMSLFKVCGAKTN